MKKLNTKFCCFLAALLLFSSACKNEEELIEFTPQTEESASVNTFLTTLSSQSGSVLDEASQDQYTGLSLLFDFGFNFVYPIQLAYNNGSSVSVESFDELLTIVELIDTDLFINEIAFPFSVEVFNHVNNTIEIETIKNEVAFNDLIGRLGIGIEKVCIRSLDYDPVYVEVTTPDSQKIILTYSNAFSAYCDNFSQDDFIDGLDSERIVETADMQANPIISDILAPSCLYSDSTSHIYNIAEKKVVALVRANSVLMGQSLAMKFYVFHPYESDERISMFVNNLYSDGLFIEVAEPVATYDVPSENIELISTFDLGEVTECNQTSKSNATKFELKVDEYSSSDEKFSFGGFSTEITVYKAVVEDNR